MTCCDGMGIGEGTRSSDMERIESSSSAEPDVIALIRRESLGTSEDIGTRLSGIDSVA